MSALEDAARVVDAVKTVRLETLDLVAATAVALGMLIAEQAFPEPPYRSIIASGALIGAGSAWWRKQTAGSTIQEAGHA